VMAAISGPEVDVSGGSQVGHDAEPEEVAGALKARAGPVIDRLGVHRVFPVEVELHELVEVPVEADIDHFDLVGPEIGVGQSAGEHLLAEGQFAEAGVDLEGAEPALSAAKVEGMDRVDERGSLARLAGEQISRLDEIPRDGEVDGPG